METLPWELSFGTPPFRAGDTNLGTEKLKCSHNLCTCYHYERDTSIQGTLFFVPRVSPEWSFRCIRLTNAWICRELFLVFEIPVASSLKPLRRHDKITLMHVDHDRILYEFDQYYDSHILLIYRQYFNRIVQFSYDMLKCSPVLQFKNTTTQE